METPLNDEYSKHADAIEARESVCQESEGQTVTVNILVTREVVHIVTEEVPAVELRQYLKARQDPIKNVSYLRALADHYCHDVPANVVEKNFIVGDLEIEPFDENDISALSWKDVGFSEESADVK